MTRRVAIVCAPAGFGKSTLIEHVLALDPRPSVHITFKREEAALDQTARRLCRDAAVLAPTALRNLPSALRSTVGRRGRAADLAMWFLRHLVDGGGLIAIDDVEHAASAESAEFLRTLVSTVTSNSWIVAGRTDLGLPRAQWIADGLMDAAVERDELAFDAAELMALSVALGTRGSDADRKAIVGGTEGWPMSAAFALGAPEHFQIISAARAATRERLFDHVAEAMLAGLDERSCAVVALAAEIGTIDPGTLAEAGFEVDWAPLLLRQRVPFVRREARGRLVFHPLCRDAFSRLTVPAISSDRIVALSETLLARRRPSAALRLLINRRLVEPLATILGRIGTELADAGREGLLVDALAVIGADAGDSTPVGLRTVDGDPLGRAPAGRMVERVTPESDGSTTEQQAIELARIAREEGDDRSAARAYDALATFARAREELRRAAHYGERVSYHAARCGDATLRASSLTARFSIAVESGDIVGAARIGRWLERFRAASGERVGAAEERVARTVLAFATHRLGDVAALLEAPLPAATGPALGALLVALRACLACVREDSAGAQRAFEAARDATDFAVLEAGNFAERRSAALAAILLAAAASALGRPSEGDAWLDAVEACPPDGALGALAGLLQAEPSDPNRGGSALGGYSAIMSIIRGAAYGANVDGRPLTATESLLLRHLAHRESEREIAAALGLRIGAVRTTLDAIAVKLRCNDRRGIIAAAKRLGYLDAEIARG